MLCADLTVRDGVHGGQSEWSLAPPHPLLLLLFASLNQQIEQETDGFAPVPAVSVPMRPLRIRTARFRLVQASGDPGRTG